MMLVPPDDRVLCRLTEPETHTAFGLELPETAQETPLRAVVLAVGAGAVDRNGDRYELGPYLDWAEDYDEHGNPDGDAWWLMHLEAGDEVILPRRGGSEIEFDGETVISILGSEILARIEIEPV